jgi:hypothetical protein
MKRHVFSIAILIRGKLQGHFLVFQTSLFPSEHVNRETGTNEICLILPFRIIKLINANTKLLYQGSRLLMAEI